MTSDQKPERNWDVDTADRWFDDMQRRYPEPRPASDDPEEMKAWTARGLAWARRVDPDGADAAMTALCEEAVDRGLCEHAGVDASGRIVYRSLVYRGG